MEYMGGAWGWWGGVVLEYKRIQILGGTLGKSRKNSGFGDDFGKIETTAKQFGKM